ncbi:MAG TPA: DegV family protein [Anaerolineae bacterium]|nr:DegV family protein [Anaerolineae bacterium]
MNIRIVTDSTCDLPKDIIRKLGISIVPDYINVGEQSFLDEVEITREEFYKRLPKFSTYPKTSAPGVGIFENVYHKLALEGATHIVSVHITNKLSNLANVARLAGEIAKNIKVIVMEIGSLSMGLGFLVVAAARAALEGCSVEKILEVLKEQDSRTHVYAAIDTLEFLKRSGRVPGLVAGIADLLHIRPILHLHKGIIKIEKVRTAKKAIERIITHIKKLGPLEELGVIHTNAEQKAQQFTRFLQKTLFLDYDPWIVEATPIIGVHTGPGAIGLACIKAK